MIHVNGNFILNSGSTLTLSGGANDFFIFNIAAGFQFKINGSEILLAGGLDASQVLFNVLGPPPGPDDAIIQQSLVFGTILAPARNILVNDNQYADGNGLYGAIITGGKLLFAESDITHDPYCEPMGNTVPDSGTTLALLAAALGAIGVVRRKFGV